jgi:hypothetical protein
MCVPSSKVSYTSATTGREDREVHKGHVVVLGKEKKRKEKKERKILPHMLMYQV